MKIVKAEGSQERTLLIAMIVDKAVLATVAARWAEPGLFSSRWANLIGTWCVQHYQRYKRPPGKDITGLFDTWANQARRDRETVQLVEKFLTSLSGQYRQNKESINSDYILDLAGRHFARVQFQRLRDEIDAALDSEDVNECESVIRSFSRIELGDDQGASPFDENEAEKALHAKQEPLVAYPEGLGAFFGSALERDAFVAFMGPEKRGKCVAGSMLVTLADGSVRSIGSIVRDKVRSTKVLSLNEQTGKFEPRPVAQFWDNGRKDCWEVRTRTGRCVVTTSNHKYLTPDGWKEIGEVGVGEFIAVPKIIPVWGTKEVNVDELRFTAFMLAEGGCTSVQQTFTNTDPELIALFEQTCNNLGVGFTVRTPWTTVPYHALRKTTALSKRLGGMYRLSSKTKFIPKWVFTAPKQQVAEFLRVFFSCDGYITKWKGARIIGMALANRRMLRQISHLLNRFGIVHTFKKRIAKCGGKEFPCWRITINSGEYVNRFLQEINFYSYKRTEPSETSVSRSFLDKLPWQVAKRLYEELKAEYAGRFYRFFGKHKAGHVHTRIAQRQPIMRQSFAHVRGHPTVEKYLSSDVLWDEVVSVQYVGKKRTYDLGVEENHNFIANDCLVHNTWFLLDVAWTAMTQGKRVAFFEVGDMSRNQVTLRFLVRAARHPSGNSKTIWPKRVKWPTAIEYDIDDKTTNVTHKVVEFKKPLDVEKAKAACRKVTEKLDGQEYLKLFVYPNSTIDVHGVQSQVESLARRGWVPDVVVIDYADILAPPKGYSESRDQINATWKALRALSQSMHCLVVTATQAKATSYQVSTLGKQDYSEDKRKLAHVTGMVGLNQDHHEKVDGIMRLNWIVLREEEYSEEACCRVATCYPLGCPCVVSYF